MDLSNEVVYESNGVKTWYVKEGSTLWRHRIDGPAVMGPNGDFWYVEGEQCESTYIFQQRAGLTDEEMSLLILKYGDFTPPELEIDEEGNECWYDEAGELHREDGPAIVGHNLGYEVWYQHGKLHRDGGPASYSIYGHSVEWFFEGKLIESALEYQELTGLDTFIMKGLIDTHGGLDDDLVEDDEEDEDNIGYFTKV